MNKRLLSATSLLLLCVHTLYLSGYLQEEPSIDLAEERLEEAFSAVKEAEIAGADESELVELVNRLNEALSLIEMARKGVEHDVSRSIEISEAVIKEAGELKALALDRSFKLRITAFCLVPILSAITTFSLNYIYEWWRRREVKRLLRMIAKKKERS